MRTTKLPLLDYWCRLLNVLFKISIHILGRLSFFLKAGICTPETKMMRSRKKKKVNTVIVVLYYKAHRVEVTSNFSSSVGYGQRNGFDARKYFQKNTSVAWRSWMEPVVPCVPL